MIIVWTLFRSFSKKTDRRLAERTSYLRIRGTVTSKLRRAKDRWRDRKTHRYYTCPSCGASVRIRYPGRGKSVSITCPKCGANFTKKT